MESVEERLSRKIYTIFLYACLKVSNPKSKNNRWIEWKIFQGCFKQKKMKRLSFYFWVFTNCRKMLGKMPVRGQYSPIIIRIRILWTNLYTDLNLIPKYHKPNKNFGKLAFSFDFNLSKSKFLPPVGSNPWL